MRRAKFGEFEIDLDLFTLSNQGKPVEIGRRIFDLLVCLIENRNRVADHELLRREVWQSAALSAAAIPTCILELRKLLGDDATAPTFIESIRGRGYRFIAKVTRTSTSLLDLSHSAENLAFCGRDLEMTTLNRCARASLIEARGFTILINGEAGIGKTRLLEEFLTQSRSVADVLISHSPNLEGTPPLWPWTQVLRAAMKGIGAKNRKFVECVQALSSVFPEVRGSVDSSSLQANRVDQFTIFSLWARSIRSLIGPPPLILAFEDIHRADADSLALLYQLSQELANDPVLLIATHRPEAASKITSNQLLEIAGVPNAVRIDLRPLSANDICTLLDPLLDDRAEISEALRCRTSGIPFYLTHVLRMFSQDFENQTKESLLSALPSNAGDLVSRQLSDLPEETREALAVAAIEGERFSIQSLSILLGLPASDVLRQLEPAVQAWIVVDEGAEFTFSHALLRDALYQTINPTKRRNIHLSLARLLADRTDAYAMYSQISDHLANAIPLAPMDEARRFAALAGREAAERFAFERAKVLFHRAYSLALSDPASPLEDRCDIMRNLARALLYTGDRIQARQLLLETAQISRTIHAPHILAACALELAPDFLSIEVGSYDPILIQLLEEALVAIPANDLALRARLHSRMAQANQWSSMGDRAEDMAIKALSLARASGDSEALLAALSARAESLHGPARVADRLEYIVELGTVARRQSGITPLLVQKTRLMAGLLEVGEIQKLSIENELYRKIATELGLPQYKWYPGATDAMLAMLQGRIADAERLATQYRASAGKNPDQNFAQTYACQHVVREIERDRGPYAIPMVSEFASQHATVYSWSAALAWLQWDSGDSRAAEASLQRFSNEDIDAMAREAGGGIGIAVLSEVAANLGDNDRLGHLFRIVDSIKNRYVSAGYGIAYFGSFARYAGLLANRLGDPCSGIRLLELAVEQEAAIGSKLWQCYAQIDLLSAYDQSRAWPVERDLYVRNLYFQVLELDLPRVQRKLTEADVPLSNGV